MSTSRLILIFSQPTNFYSRLVAHSCTTGLEAEGGVTEFWNVVRRWNTFRAVPPNFNHCSMTAKRTMTRCPRLKWRAFLHFPALPSLYQTSPQQWRVTCLEQQPNCNTSLNVSITSVSLQTTLVPYSTTSSWSRFLGSQYACDLVINPVVGCRHFPPGPRLLSQPKRSPPWPVPNYTAWWQRHTGVSSLYKTTIKSGLEPVKSWLACVYHQPCTTMSDLPKFAALLSGRRTRNVRTNEQQAISTPWESCCIIDRLVLGPVQWTGHRAKTLLGPVWPSSAIYCATLNYSCDNFFACSCSWQAIRTRVEKWVWVGYYSK